MDRTHSLSITSSFYTPQSMIQPDCTHSKIVTCVLSTRALIDLIFYGDRIVEKYSCISDEDGPKYDICAGTVDTSVFQKICGLLGV
jgi:hypothetical protein